MGENREMDQVQPPQIMAPQKEGATVTVMEKRPAQPQVPAQTQNQSQVPVQAPAQAQAQAPVQAQAQAQNQAQSQGPQTVPKCADPLFAYTQGKYWGGATLNFTIYRILTVLGGLVGLDHFYLRSPTTAVAKILLNVLTFGMWFFYDIFQAFAERESIEKYGLSMPWYGPTGIAAGGFVSDSNPAVNNANPFWFMLYAVGLFILPFGLDYLVAGDYVGAGMKAISTLMVFGLLYTVINIYKLLAHPEQVMCEGTSRFFPWSIVPGVNKHFQEAFFANTNRGSCPAEPKADSSLLGLLGGIFRGLKGVPVIGTFATAASAVANAAQIVTEVPTKLKDGMQAASTELNGAPGRASSANPLPPSVPATLTPTPLTAPSKQTGGANPHQSAEQGNLFLGFTFALLFIGAIFYRGRDVVAQYIERAAARPPPIGTILWRKENVGDVPPAPPQP